MIKSLGVLVGGIFVGAVSAEVLRKKWPGVLGELYAKGSDIASKAREAFKDGYESATQPKVA